MIEPADKGALGAALGRLSHQYPMLAAKRAGSELFGAPRLNAFTLFQPNEVRLSRIIADLFDPVGSHGQDNLFLNALLSTLELPRVGVADHVAVRREMVTKAGRQIDLVIELPALLIGIENKPWAAQQPEQLADYVAALQGWARGRVPVLIFLSNKEPETAGDEVRVVRLHSDEEEPALNQVLNRCLDRVRAPRTRMHVEELLAYLASEFGSEPMTTDADAAFVEAVEAEYERSTESRRAIAMTLLAKDRLHFTLLQEIATALIYKFRETFADIEEEYDDCSISEALGDKDNWWGLRRPTWPENCSVSLSPSRTNFGDIYFGVRAPDRKSKYVDKGDDCALRTQVAEAVSEVEGGSSSAFWPWWKYAEPRSWAPEQLASLLLQSPTGRLADHPRMKDLADRMLALVVAVDQSVSARK